MVERLSSGSCFSSEEAIVSTFTAIIPWFSTVYQRQKSIRQRFSLWGIGNFYKKPETMGEHRKKTKRFRYRCLWQSKTCAFSPQIHKEIDIKGSPLTAQASTILQESSQDSAQSCHYDSKLKGDKWLQKHKVFNQSIAPKLIS